jgi:hypothetical protein
MKTNNLDFGKSFKFKHKNEVGSTVYTYHKPSSQEQSAKVTWQGPDSNYGDGYCMYSVENAKQLVQKGYWIVLPSESTDNSPNIEKKSEDNLLDEIKAFTASSKHSVNIYEGVYEVFRSGEDGVYKCADDETLKKVMSALKVLDGVLVNEVVSE